MPNININIANKRATTEGSPVIVCGNSDYMLQLTFDDEWSAATYKTARFVYVQNGQVLHEDRDFNGTEVQVPALANTTQVKVGVFAGELYTSTPAVIPCKASILCGSGEPANPTPEEDARIMELLNLAIKQQAQAEAAAEAAEAAKDAAEAIVAEEIVKFAPVIAQTAAGSPILLQDSSDNKLVGFSVRRKNLLKNTATSQTVKGVTYTVNDDGSITADGTATEQSAIYLGSIKLTAGSYILSGCPSGGSASTYMVYTISALGSEFGGGLNLQITEETTFNPIIIVKSGVTVNNLTFYPMIRLAEVEDDTFAPYIEDDDSIEVKSCGKNELNNTAASITKNGISFIVNADKSVTVSGTCSATTYLTLGTLKSRVGGQYKLTGCPSGGKAGETYCFYVNWLKNGVYNQTVDTGDSKTTPVFDEVLTLTSNVIVYEGCTVEGLTFYPMIRPAEVEDDTYEPYKESTAEVTLTDQTQAQQLRTYKPVTYITASDGAVMGVEYAADTKKYIDNKIAEICAAMLNS